MRLPVLRGMWTAIRLGWQAHRGVAAGVILLSLLAAACPVGAAWATKLLFDALGWQPAVAADIAPLALAATALGALTVIIGRVISYLNQVLQAEVSVTVSANLAAKVNSFVGTGWAEDPAFRDRLQLAEQAASQAPFTMTTFVSQTIQNLIRVAGFIVVIGARWPWLALVLVVVAVPELLAQLRLARLQADAEGAVMTSLRTRTMFHQLIHDHRAAREIRLYGLADFLQNRMTAAYRNGNRLRLSVERRVMRTQVAFSLVAVVLGGGIAVVATTAMAEGRLSLGDVTLMLAAVGGVQTGLSSVAAHAGGVGEAIRLFDGYLRIVDAPEPLPRGTAVPVRLRQGIEFRDVWFRYDEGPWVLRGVNLSIAHGESVGLVGVNGAGKSTLVKLLCRFHDPQKGAIYWDGVDLRELDAGILRTRISATFQDFMCYDLTAAENIGVGDLAHLSDLDRIAAAAAQMEIAGMIQGLPKGYQTMLSRTFADEDTDAGVTVSGGQWQRIALARSLMRDDADLLILDEPSSGLDAEAEVSIHHALRRHQTGRTGLLVSHRLSALRHADRIAVLSDGVIGESGSHDELMNARGDYARVFGVQAAGYQDRRVSAA